MAGDPPLARTAAGVIVMDPRRRRIPLSDQHRIAEARGELAAAAAEASEAGTKVDKFCERIESGEMMRNGVVMEPLAEEDSLVHAIDDAANAAQLEMLRQERPIVSVAPRRRTRTLAR